VNLLLVVSIGGGHALFCLSFRGRFYCDCNTKPINVTRQVWIGFKPSVLKTEVSNEVVSAVNIRIVSSTPATFGDPIINALPDQMIAWDQTTINCGGSAASATLQISQQTQTSSSIAVSNSVTHSQSYQFGLSGTLGDKEYGSVTLSGSVSIGSSTTSGQINTVAEQNGNTRQGSSQKSADPNTSLTGEFQVWPIQYKIPFSATVTADADLQRIKAAPRENSATTAPFIHLSDLFDANKRTFPVNGTIQVTQASQGQVVWKTPVPLSPAQCAKYSGGVQTLSVRKVDKAN
jgi:hypothetical protein